ncbi:MAG: phosphatidate cytidylyltransferase [Cocleimonas sp.]|nr:phosphatidate cytidylyltransferase [Cocleimonas sp.]
MLKQRVITGILLAIAALFGVLLLPKVAFAVISLIIFIGIGGWEWASLTGYKVILPRMLFIVALLLVAIACYFWGKVQWFLVMLGLLWWVYAVYLVFQYKKEDHSLENKAWVFPVSAFAVLVPAWFALLALQMKNPDLVLYLIFLVAIADSGAYFTGKAMGVTKLAPHLSPGKTWEGFFGGVLGAGIWALLATQYFKLSIVDSLILILLSLLVAAMSVVGDLYESMLKREANEKDSGTLLPGHGGVLDRVDGLLAALPLFTLGLLLIDGIAI